MKCLYIGILAVLIGCHGGKSCFEQSISQDIVGLWTLVDNNSLDHQVEFMANGTGQALGEGYFTPIINTDRTFSFTWKPGVSNTLHITWTNVNQEIIQAELQIHKSTCKQIKLSDSISEQFMVWKRN